MDPQGVKYRHYFMLEPIKITMGMIKGTKEQANNEANCTQDTRGMSSHSFTFDIT